MPNKNHDFKNLIILILLGVLFLLLTGTLSTSPGISEYRVNSFQEEENLERWVNEEIKKGWQPIGGVTTCYIKYSDGNWGLHHSQALVK